jgi:hypothetical protein
VGEFVISCELAFQAASLKNLCVPVQTVSFTKSIGKLSLELAEHKGVSCSKNSVTHR